MRGRPWHHRRLRVRPGGRRTSAAARLRAHVLALGAGYGRRARSRMAEFDLTALLDYDEAVALRTRLAKREAARRWA
jgi:hypothetical protein